MKRARNKIHDFNTKAASIFTVLLLAFFMGSSQMENRSLLRATRLFESNQFSEAIPFFDKAIKYGNADERKEATERIADCYRILGNLYRYRIIRHKNFEIGVYPPKFHIKM